MQAAKLFVLRIGLYGCLVGQLAILRNGFVDGWTNERVWSIGWLAIAAVVLWEIIQIVEQKLPERPTPTPPRSDESTRDQFGPGDDFVD